MIYTTNSGEFFDTERDFSDAERHILQKLFIWKEMASSAADFRKKKEEALRTGWNNSGPIPESPAMKSITKDLEEQVSLQQPVRKPPCP
jgi:hypothetical protein